MFQVVRAVILVGIGMLIFRAENLRAAGRMFLSLFNREAWHSAGFFWDVGMDPYEYLVILLGVLIVLYVGIKNERKDYCKRPDRFPKDRDTYGNLYGRRGSGDPAGSLWTGIWSC